MAATYKKATRKFVGRDNWIPEGDIREILAIVGPGEMPHPETGEPNAKAFLVIAGPKGGSFKLFLPEWFYNQSGNDIIVGDGISNGGWRNGQFIVPEFYEAD